MKLYNYTSRAGVKFSRRRVLPRPDSDRGNAFEFLSELKAGEWD